jgi:hypothetical protein
MEPSPLLSKQGLSKETKNTNLKHPHPVDLISRKQNKLPSFIDKLVEKGWKPMP